MVVIKVTDVIGSKFCTSPSVGDVLFEKIQPLVSNSQEFTLDFSDVRVVNTTFLNHAIGLLYKQFEINTLENCMVISNTKPLFDEQIKLVKNNALQSHSQKSLNDFMVQDLDHE